MMRDHPMCLGNFLKKVRYKGVSEDAKPPQDSANAAAS